MTVHRERLARLLKGNGIEIGALHRPLEVGPAARVTYVDRLPLAALVSHYPELAGRQLAPVDVIGSAEDLSALRDGSQDFVIANHLIEHLEDPIRALKEFARVLRPGGLLFMCVPDARVTFDRHRPLTTVEHLLGEHRGGAATIAQNRRGHFEEWVANVELTGVAGVEKPGPPGPPAARVDTLMGMGYSIHIHCWQEGTFLHFFNLACHEEAIPLEVLDTVDTVPMGADELVILAGKLPTTRQRVLAGWEPRRGLAHNLKRAARAVPAAAPLVRGYRALRRIGRR